MLQLRDYHKHQWVLCKQHSQVSCTPSLATQILQKGFGKKSKEISSGVVKKVLFTILLIY